MVQRKSATVVYLEIPVDWEFDNGLIVCRNTSIFHFDIDPGRMRQIHDNLRDGKDRCYKVGAWRQSLL